MRALALKTYEEELKKSNMLDYDDQIIKAYELFSTNPSVLANIKDLLVGESQGVNLIMKRLIDVFLNQNKSVTMVGDKNRAVFAFRSGELTNSSSYEASECNLNENYCSTRIIIKAASSVINQDALDNDIRSSQGIEAFLNYFDENQKDQAQTDEGGKVTISTIHSSKGCEWSCIFITSCNEGCIPLISKNLDEGRRLMHIAMTRSIFFLCCVSHLYRTISGNSFPQSTLYFLNRIPRILINMVHPSWDNDMRKTLVDTLGKPVPSDDDDLISTQRKRPYLVMDQ